MDLDDLDIYEDLDTFQKEEEKKSADLLSWEIKYDKSLKIIEELQLENGDLKKQIKRIGINFQNLLDTAKAEIKRKDKQIEILRKEKDDICFRRKIPRTEYADAGSINGWNKNDAAVFLPQSYKAEKYAPSESKSVEAKKLISSSATINHTLDTLVNTRLHEEHRNDRAGRKYESHESDLNREKNKRRHIDMDKHELARYRRYSREREGSERSRTRDYSREKSKERTRREGRESRSKHIQAEERESNAYRCKRNNETRRQHSHDNMNDQLRHHRDARKISEFTESNRKKSNEETKSIKGERKKSINDYRSYDKLNNNLHKISANNLPKRSDDNKYHKGIGMKSLNFTECKRESGKDLNSEPVNQIKKDNFGSKSSANTKISDESIIFKSSSAGHIAAELTTETRLTKEKLLALETAIDKNTNCMLPTDGMTTPKKSQLFHKLFGSTPSNTENVNSNAIVMLQGSRDSTTTSPSNYTDTSENIALSSKVSLQKLETDDGFVPINCNRKLPDDCESVITLSATSEINYIHIPGLGNETLNNSISAKQTADVTNGSSNTKNRKENLNANANEENTIGNKNNTETVNHTGNSDPIVLSDEEDFFDLENIVDAHQKTHNLPANNWTIEGLTMRRQNNDIDKRTLVNVRAPNIYEIRAHQRRLRAEADKSHKNGHSTTVEDITPWLEQRNATNLGVPETEPATNEPAQLTSSSAEIFKGLLQNHDVKIKNNLAENSSHEPQKDPVGINVSLPVNDEKGDKDICTKKNNKKKNVEGDDSKKQNIDSTNSVETANSYNAEDCFEKSKPTSKTTTNCGTIEVEETENVSKIESSVGPEADGHNKGKKFVILEKTEFTPEAEAEELLLKSSSAPLASYEKKENKSNLLPKTCVIEEKVPDKSQSTHWNTTEDTPAFTEIEKQTENKKQHSSTDCEKVIFLQRDIPINAISNSTEGNCSKAGNVITQVEGADEITHDSESQVVKNIDNNGTVQKVLNKADEWQSSEEQSVSKLKIVVEQKILHEQKSDPKISDERKTADEQNLPDEQTHTAENHLVLVNVQKATDEMLQVGPAKQISAEFPNERSKGIENVMHVTNTSDVIASSKANTNRIIAEIDARPITPLQSRHINSKAINTGDPALTSVITNIVSNKQSLPKDNDQISEDDRNAADNLQHSKIEEIEKNASVVVESESQELEDAVAYLIRSMGTEEKSCCLDDMKTKAQLLCEEVSEKPESKALAVHLKQNKLNADNMTDAEIPKCKSTQLLQSANPQRDALIDNMKRSEIMWKFKIPKIGTKRKRENNDGANIVKDSAANTDILENNAAKSLLVSVKGDLDTKSIESELIDIQLLNGRTPEEERALSAEKAKSERIIKEIDNWARGKVGNTSEVIVLEPAPIESTSQLSESKLVATSITLEEEPKERERKKKDAQLANKAVVQLEDLKNAPSQSLNKRCKYEKSDVIKESDTNTKQKTDNQNLHEENKSKSLTHAIPTIKFPIISKKRTSAIKEHGKSQLRALSVFSEERQAEDDKTFGPIRQRTPEDKGRDKSPDAPGFYIASNSRLKDRKSHSVVVLEESDNPAVSNKNQLKLDRSREAEQKEAVITTATQMQKLINIEKGSDSGNKLSTNVPIENKTKISLPNEITCATSQGTSGTQKQSTKRRSIEKISQNYKPPKEKAVNDVVGKKRVTEKRTVRTGSAEKRAKLKVDTINLESIHTTAGSAKDKKVSSTKRQNAVATAADDSSIAVSSCSDIDASHTTKVSSHADNTAAHQLSKVSKRRRSDVSESDDCEIVPKSRNRKRCKMRIEDSEEEDECTPATQPNEKTREVSATDLPNRNTDILDILQNDRANESNDVLPAPQTPTSLPANISQDEKYKELDSRLELMFASPKVVKKICADAPTRVIPQLAADIAVVQKQKFTQPAEQSSTSLGASSATEPLSTNATHTVDFNVSDTSLSDISSHSLHVSHMNVTIDETNHSEMFMNSTLSDSNSSTKHISLGSSNYRFEKVSDSVVHLFISRKRRGKRKQTIATTTTTTTMATTTTTPDTISTT